MTTTKWSIGIWLGAGSLGRFAAAACCSRKSAGRMLAAAEFGHASHNVREGERLCSLTRRLQLGAQLRRAALLPRAGIAVQGAALNRAVDLRDELLVLGVGRAGVPRIDRCLEAAEVRLDGRRVAAVFEPLALRPVNPLFL